MCLLATVWGLAAHERGPVVPACGQIDAPAHGGGRAGRRRIGQIQRPRQLRRTDVGGARRRDAHRQRGDRSDEDRGFVLHAVDQAEVSDGTLRLGSATRATECEIGKAASGDWWGPGPLPDLPARGPIGGRARRRRRRLPRTAEAPSTPGTPRPEPGTPHSSTATTLGIPSAEVDPPAPVSRATAHCGAVAGSRGDQPSARSRRRRPPLRGTGSGRRRAGVRPRYRSRVATRPRQTPGAKHPRTPVPCRSTPRRRREDDGRHRGRARHGRQVCGHVRSPRLTVE